MATIFISYSRRDSDFVEFIEPRIHNIYGFASLWYDKSSEGIQGGDEWWTTIVNRIRDCQLFLFLVSDSSVASENCQKELRKAIYNRKTVLPVLLQTYTLEYPAIMPDDLSEYMHKVQYIDFRKGYDDLSLLWGAIHRIIDHSLSRVNRWILYNQYEMLRLLNMLATEPQNAEHYERQQQVLGDGYEWYYDQISGQIVPPMEYGDGEEVMTILDMYRAIHNACVENADCSDIPLAHRKFHGFDGNHEAEYLAFARFTIEVEGRYTESAPDATNNPDLNSHIPMLPTYRRMLEKWRLSENQNSLTKEDIIRILNA